MIAHKIIIFSIVFKIYQVTCQEQSETLCDKEMFVNSENIVIYWKEYCINGSKPCIISKCAQNEVEFKQSENVTTCVNISSLKGSLSGIPDVYKTNYYDNKEKSNKSFFEAFNLVWFKSEDNCSVEWFPGRLLGNVMILENGYLLRDTPNILKRFDVIKKYGMKLVAEKGMGDNYDISMQILFPIEEDFSEDDDAIIFAYGMLVSAFFLLCVLIVYGLLKELRTLFGVTLMAFVATLACGFVLKATYYLTMYFQQINEVQCKILCPVMWYVQTSSFFWMNVISFESWWTFRCAFYQCPRDQRVIWNKFKWYTLYACGIPLVVTIAEVIIDNMDLTHIPNFIKPLFGTCTSNSTAWYVLGPCAGVQCINLVLLVVTSYNVRRLSIAIKSFSKDEKTKNQDNNNIFVLYLKLSVMMGTNWIMDVLLEIKVADWINYIANGYNTLSGIIIFIVFIIKIDILLKLCKKFCSNHPLTKKVEQRMKKRNSTYKMSFLRSRSSNKTANSMVICSNER